MRHTLDVAFFLLLLLGAVLLGHLISVQPLGFPVYFIVGFFAVILSIYDIRIAIGFLAISMLFSPEITLAEVPARAVVVRFDDLILILIFIVWIAKMAINKKIPLIKATPINNYIYFYMAACVLFTGKGAVLGDVNFKKAAFYLLKYLEYFIVFWMTYNVIEKKKDVNILLSFATLTALAIIVYGYTQINTIVSAPFDREPGSLGGYFIILLGISLGIFMYHKSSIAKMFALSVFVLIIPLLIKAQSRASYLAFIVMYFMIIVLTKRFRKTLIGGAALLVLAIPYVFGKIDIFEQIELYQTLKERVSYTFSGGYGVLDLEPSAAARIITWQRGMLRDWPKRPLTGWGITGRGFIDSQYVRTAVELGLIGFGAFLLLLYKIWDECMKVFDSLEMDWKKGMVVGFVAAFIGLLFHAITTNTFIIVRIMEPFWFILAIILAFPKLEEAK
ncbi:O-antigen ligase family protein [Elusimicrobiota bacterium]